MDENIRVEIEEETSAIESDMLRTCDETRFLSLLLTAWKATRKTPMITSRETNMHDLAIPFIHRCPSLNKLACVKVNTS